MGYHSDLYIAMYKEDFYLLRSMTKDFQETYGFPNFTPFWGDVKTRNAEYKTLEFQDHTYIIFHTWLKMYSLNGSEDMDYFKNNFLQKYDVPYVFYRVGEEPDDVEYESNMCGDYNFYRLIRIKRYLDFGIDEEGVNEL